MKRFISFLMFALVLGAGQAFAFDDVGDQQTVVTDKSDQYSDLTFEELVFAAVEVQKDTGQPQVFDDHNCMEFKNMTSGQVKAKNELYTHSSDLKARRMQYTPRLHYEKRQDCFAEFKLPPNYRVAYS